MSNNKIVAYCGGKWECEESGCTFSNPCSGNVESILENWGDAIGTSPNRPRNETDADAFIINQEIEDGKIISSELHVFKTNCSQKMTCGYNGSGKIINDNTNIWKKKIYSGNSATTIVIADYDKFIEPSIRIGSYGNDEAYSGFATPSTVEYSFINVDGDIPASTNEGMFQNVSALTTCSIPCQMRTISKNTFKGCTNLTDYTNPDWFEIIGVSAFEGCQSLLTIKIGRPTKISDSSFANCTNAYTIDWCKLKISDKSCMKDIPPYAFHNCTNLRYSKFSGDTRKDAIIIPKGISGISTHAFSECSSIQNLDLNDVTVIGDHAFEHCISLSGITGMSNVTSVGQYAFNLYGNKWKMSSMGDLSQMVKIDNSAFMYVTFDGDINLTNPRLDEIGDYAFYSTIINGNLSIGSNVQNIPYECFYGSAISGDVIIESSKIGNEAFYDSAISGDVTIKSGEIGIEAFYQSAISGDVTIESSKIGGSAFGWSNIYGSFDFSNITEIEELAFYYANFKIQKSLDLSNVRHIYPKAFNYCSGVTDIIFGDVNLNPDNSDDGAIQSNNTLTAITFNGSAIINNNEFKSCKTLKYITINNSNITRNGANQFGECNGLVITLGSTVDSFDGGANGFFYDAGSISEVNVLYYQNLVRDLTYVFNSASQIAFKIYNSNLVSQYTTLYSNTSWTFSALQ